MSLGGNVNTRRMSKPDMGSIFHIKNQWNTLVIGNYDVNYQSYQTFMLFTSSVTKRTLMHLFLFTNSAQRELVSICTHYNLDNHRVLADPNHSLNRYIQLSFFLHSIILMSCPTSPHLPPVKGLSLKVWSCNEYAYISQFLNC